MNMDLETKECPYCGMNIPFKPDVNEYSCPNCNKSFFYLTGEEIGEDGKLITEYNPIKVSPIKLVSKRCLNCDKEFQVEPFVEQDFCTKCFYIVCKAVFDKSNSNLTCKQLIDKIRLGGNNEK